MIQWFAVGNSQTQERVSIYDRTAGFDPETGEVYLPATVFGGQNRNFIAMAADGLPIIFSNRRLYCPSDWLAKEHPAMRCDIEKIVKKVVSFANSRQGRRTQNEAEQS